MMNMTDAIKALHEMYPDTYTAATVEITRHGDGQMGAKCTLYVDGLKHHSGATWEAAFASLALADRTTDDLLELAA
jgi:hypothetical protein